MRKLILAVSLLASFSSIAFVIPTDLVKHGSSYVCQTYPNGTTICW